VPKKVPSTMPATPPLVMPEHEGTEVGVDWRAERGGKEGGRYCPSSVQAPPSDDANGREGGMCHFVSKLQRRLEKKLQDN
jgi:hypothetical protein